MHPSQDQRHDGHRAMRIAGTALIAVATFLPASAHGAAKPPSAVCASTYMVTVTPGFTPTPSAGRLTTNGQTASIECFGTIRGGRVTGPGTVGFTLRHRGGSCRGHVGTGKVHLIIPTTAGTVDMVGTLAVRRTGLTVRVKVRFPGVRYSGNGVVFPRVGDCASTPLEQVKVTLTGTLRDT